MVLLGYKERDAAERTLWPMLRDADFNLEKVGEKVGAGANPVEVWIARAHRYRPVYDSPE